MSDSEDSSSSSSSSSEEESRQKRSGGSKRRSPSQGSSEDEKQVSKEVQIKTLKPRASRSLTPEHENKATEKAEERDIVLSCSENEESLSPGRNERVKQKIKRSDRSSRSSGGASTSESESPSPARRRSEIHRPRPKSQNNADGQEKRSRSPSRSPSPDYQHRTSDQSSRNRRSQSRDKYGSREPVNQLDRPRGRVRDEYSRSRSRSYSRSPDRSRSRDRRDRRSLKSKVYRVEWNRGNYDERSDRRRDDRQRKENRETETERRRREREKRHAEREEREQRDAKRRRDNSPPPRAPSEEGEITQPANDDDLDYLRAKQKKAQEDTIMTRTGGAYIPPARLRMMQEAITDKASKEFQRIAWEALKKSINGLINKVNVSNIVLITRELLAENIVRGRGLLARAVITAQAASPTFTHVYAALVAIINTKFPQIGELILKRLVLQFKKSFRRNDKAACLSSVRFVAHLVNQQVAHEIIALEILFLLMQNPTDDSVEVAVGFLQEVGQKLGELSPKAIIGVFERLRTVLHEAQIEKRTQYMIEVMFQVRKDGFKDHPSVLSELDLVDEDDQFTHSMRLEDAVNGEDMLNVFKFDPDYEATEEKYKELKREILDEESSGSESGSGSDESSSEDEEGEKKEEQQIMDMTETNLVAFRRVVYLTIQSSLDFEECAHKLLKMDIKPGWESELCNMMLDCCGQQRTYEKFFGLLAQRFCMIDRKYIEPFQEIFREQYQTVHRLETNKLRNVGKFFSHLLHTDAISWAVLEVIRLTEDDTTSSSRIFIKVLFQDLSEYMGLQKLNERLTDQTLSMYFEGLFPRDSPKNTRFAINFFTSIGLGGLTDELRAHLKTMPKPVPQVVQPPSSDSSSDDSSSSSSSDSSSDSDSSSSSSEEERKRKKKKTKKKVKKNAKAESSSSSDEEEDRNRKKKKKKNLRSANDTRSSRRKKDESPERSHEKQRGDRRRGYPDTDVGHARRRSMEGRDPRDFRFGENPETSNGFLNSRNHDRRRNENRDSEFEEMLENYKEDQRNRRKKKTKNTEEVKSKKSKKHKKKDESSISESDSEAENNVKRREHSERDKTRDKHQKSKHRDYSDSDAEIRNDRYSKQERGDYEVENNRRKPRQDSSSGVEFIDNKGRRGKAKGGSHRDRDSSENTSMSKPKKLKRSKRDDHIHKSSEDGEVEEKRKSNKESKRSKKTSRDSSSASPEPKRKRSKKTDKRSRHDSSSSDEEVDKENRHESKDNYNRKVRERELLERSQRKRNERGSMEREDRRRSVEKRERSRDNRR